MTEIKLPGCVRRLYIRNDRPLGQDWKCEDDADRVQYRANGWGAEYLEFPLDTEPLVRAVQVQRLRELETFIGYVFDGGVRAGEAEMRTSFRTLMGCAPSGGGA